MKKYLLIIALILAATPSFSQELFESPEDLERVQESFFETPFSAIPEVKVEEVQIKAPLLNNDKPAPNGKDGSTTKPCKGMPLFKKTRIKVTNYLREKDYQKTQKLLEKEKELLKKQNKDVDEDLDVNTPSQEEEILEKPLELEGAVREHVAPNDVLLDADNIEYNDETMDITATGKPVLVFPPQKVTIKADKMIYNKAANTLKAYGSVDVIRDGRHMYGDYMQINLNEENAFLDNMHTKESVMKMESEKAEMDNDKITLYNGKMVSEDSYLLDFHTRIIGGNHFYRMLIDEDEKSSVADGLDVGETAVNIKAKDVYFNAKENNNVITLKKAKIKYGDTELFRIPSITIHTDRNRNFFDANYPEFGSRSVLGMFAGPGFVFDTPLQGGSVLKAIPIINNKSGIGFGAMLKYRSATNFTHMGYGSSADAYILKGQQFLDDKLYMQYGINSYMNEWFLGRRMAKYDAELIYHDKGVIHSTIGNGLDLNFRHRFGLGFMQNSSYNRHGEHIPVNNMSTLRTRYMAEASQTLFSYQDIEKRRLFSLGLVMQGSAALYGTGDTQFIGRVGPRIHTQYKYWMQDINFFATTYQDNSPMKAYDSYRYGRANVVIREALRVNKYLTVAWSGTITLSGDSPSGDMFQENSFIVALGPDDFKINFAYDWVRRQTYFGCIIAMDTKGSSLEYEKMEIKNPDRLAKSNEEKVELKVYETENVPTKPKKMMYAQVINIEDPNREQL